jgi:hypothetical protein
MRRASSSEYPGANLYSFSVAEMKANHLVIPP